MSVTTTDSNTTAPTQFLQGRLETYAYRRVGGGIKRPLICFQHFTGTLDNWDPAVTDPLASNRDVILFDGAGIGTVDWQGTDDGGRHDDACAWISWTHCA